MNKLSITYAGKLNTAINAVYEKKLDVNFSIDAETGKTTTTSILINSNKKNFFMITFDYQELKRIVERIEEVKQK